MEVTRHLAFRIFLCLISAMKIIFQKLINNFRQMNIEVNLSKPEIQRPREEDMLSLVKELPWKDGLLYILIYKQGMLRCPF